MTTATTSFKEAFAVLQKHSNTLREQTEPNIDELLSIVTESVDAYKTCQGHITAVETALEKALSDTGSAAAPAAQRPAPVRGGPPGTPAAAPAISPAPPRASRPVGAAPPKTSAAADDAEDDIPF